MLAFSVAASLSSSVSRCPALSPTPPPPGGAGTTSAGGGTTAPTTWDGTWGRTCECGAAGTGATPGGTGCAWTGSTGAIFTGTGLGGGGGIGASGPHCVPVPAWTVTGSCAWTVPAESRTVVVPG